MMTDRKKTLKFVQMKGALCFQAKTEDGRMYTISSCVSYPENRGALLEYHAPGADKTMRGALLTHGGDDEHEGDAVWPDVWAAIEGAERHYNAALVWGC